VGKVPWVRIVSTSVLDHSSCAMRCKHCGRSDVRTVVVKRLQYDVATHEYRLADPHVIDFLCVACKMAQDDEDDSPEERE